MDGASRWVFPRLEIEVMGLAAASRDLGRRCVYCHQSSRKFDASVDKRASAPAKFGVALARSGSWLGLFYARRLFITRAVRRKAIVSELAGEKQGRRKPSTIANPKGKDITPLEGKFLSSFYTRYSPMQSAPSSDPPRLHVAERCQLGGRVRATALISSARGTVRPLGRTPGRRAVGGQSQSSRRSSVTIPSCAECDARRPAIESI